MGDRGYPISPQQGHREATDELGGSCGGVGGAGGGLSDPIQHAHKKSRPKPLSRTRVAMVICLPLGSRSAGNQLTVSPMCMCGSKIKLCHHYCSGHIGLRMRSSGLFFLRLWP